MLQIQIFLKIAIFKLQLMMKMLLKDSKLKMSLFWSIFN